MRSAYTGGARCVRCAPRWMEFTSLEHAAKGCREACRAVNFIQVCEARNLGRKNETPVQSPVRNGRAAKSNRTHAGCRSSLKLNVERDGSRLGRVAPLARLARRIFCGHFLDPRYARVTLGFDR
eukprot:5434584-Prymnesium_polylepis.1